MSRYQPLGQLVEVREAGEARRRQIFAMFDRGMTAKAAAKQLGLSRHYLVRLKKSWGMQKAASDFDPALAIGTADEFLAKPLPVQCKRMWKEKKAENRKSPGTGHVVRQVKPSKRPTSLTMVDPEEYAVGSELLRATDRYLAARGKDARRAALDAWMELRGEA